jgi:hypothetical protein
VIKLHILILIFFLVSCNNDSAFIPKNFQLSKDNITSGETLVISYNKDFNFNRVKTYLVDSEEDIIDSYGIQENTGTFKINRFLNNEIKSINNNHFIKMVFETESDFMSYTFPININNSLIIKSLCSDIDCDILSGNIIEEVPNTLKVHVAGIRAIKYTYYISILNNVYSIVHEYDLPINSDILENIVMNKVPKELSSYIIAIRVVAEDINGEFVESAIPIRVVRPLEVKHYGKHELAEVYEPVPVSGCIIGSLGNNVNYSESSTETRQSSLNIVISKSWSDSNSKNINASESEGLSIGETQSVVNSSSLSTSETNSENETYSNSTSDHESINFSSTDGENWSWSLNESNTQGNSTSNSNGNTIGGNASVSVGASGEGSLPFLAKVSGSIETTVGVSGSNTNTETNAESNSQTNGRVYTTSGVRNESASYGTAQNITNSSSLSGSYAVSRSNSNSLSQGNTDSSTRVWNMSNSISNGKVVTIGDSESISQTIFESSSSTTTFSYSGFIPRGRSGLFYRQTSRWTKLSEIVSYDINGIPYHAGYITMNTWSWAPELALGNSCKEVPQPKMEPATCYIQPCGE